MSLRPAFNPPNPWASESREWLEEPPKIELKVFEEEAKSIISTNNSPDIGFRHSLNPYRGCTHACAYCYARPTHQYLGFGAGTDFDSQIVVKTNAPSLLRKEMLKPSWKGETIVFSGNTDCYQPFEAVYKLTRDCLKACLEFRNPVSIITKSPLIVRDLDVLSELAEQAHLHVNVSLAFIDEGMQRKLEPGAAPPRRRLETLASLAKAGISVGIGLAPIIPGLNESQVPELLKQAKAAGARFAFRTLLRLPAEVEDVFLHVLKDQFPTHYDKVVHQIQLSRGGKMYDPRFGKRMSGQGQNWEAVEELYEIWCKKLGLNYLSEEAGHIDDFKNAVKTFRRPKDQMELFG